MDVYLYCYVATILWGGPPGRPLEFGHLVIGSVPSLTLGAGAAVKPRASARGFVKQAFRLCRTDALGVCLARSHECERGRPPPWSAWSGMERAGPGADEGVRPIRFAAPLLRSSAATVALGRLWTAFSAC